MKKIILLLLATFAIVSCDLGDNENIQFVLSPVEDVTMADTYKVDSVSVIKVRYKRPNDCHVFNGYYYARNGFTRTCAIEFVRMEDQSNCEMDDTVYEIPLNFKPTEAGTYTFRFWDSTNDDGTQHFFEAEAVVNN